MTLFGIKKPKPVDKKTILYYSQKFNVPKTESYEVDTSYVSYLSSLDTNTLKKQIKNHYQPLQALYFDSSERLVSFQINCYAGGFPNLRWGRNNIFTTFPPKQQAPVDSILSLPKQLTFLRGLSGSNELNAGKHDYVVVVYWSRFMGRQSKRLIRLVQENSKLSDGKKIKILYANNDNIFAAENKKK